jgi:aryl-phospho-beta-D-glucosidase BglC (GH1 family)
MDFEKWCAITVSRMVASALTPTRVADSAQTRFVHRQGKDVVSPEGKKLFLRGINLGNWPEPEGYMFEFKGGPQSPREIEALFNKLIGPKAAEVFWREYRQKYITEQDINFLSRSGFNSVRVALHYEFFVANNGEGFHLLDQLVDWCREAGTSVILDLHCAPGGQTGTNIDDRWRYPWLYESTADQALTIELWKKLALHYRDEPTVLGYDLLNEPITHFSQLAKYNPQLGQLYRQIVAAIREVDDNHIVILEAAQWDTNFGVFGPPFDDNSIYEFHKYWTATEESVISQYLNYRDEYKIPIWLDESGENTNEWISRFEDFGNEPYRLVLLAL